MKHLWLILFVIPLFAQNPCQDKEYQRLKNRIENYGYNSISTREWDYFKHKDEQCSKLTEYQNLKIVEKEPVQPFDFTKKDDCVLLLTLMILGAGAAFILTPY